MTGLEIFDWILDTNLINFIIMVWCLVWSFKKFKLGIFIDKFAENIQNDVTSSAHAVQVAFAEYKKAKNESKNTQQKKEKIEENAKEIAKKLEEKTQNEIKNKINEMDENAKKSKEFALDLKKRKTADEIQAAIYFSSVDTIKDMMNIELQEKLIFNSLDELDNGFEGAIND